MNCPDRYGLDQQMLLPISSIIIATKLCYDQPIEHDPLTSLRLKSPCLCFFLLCRLIFLFLVTAGGNMLLVTDNNNIVVSYMEAGCFGPSSRKMNIE